jgi:coenzyme F420-reducing hydrogenase beta subunit/polysaccharide pyruvyl transferase WcaK-like protein
MTISQKNNIMSYVQNSLCTGCGACSVACQNNAIEYHQNVEGMILPEIKKGCISCGMCTLVCPGNNIVRTALISVKDPFKGKNLQSCLVKATDSTIFENSQSGGAVTAILSFLLREKYISGAIVSGWCNNPENERYGKAYIAENIEELKNAQKSKYVPIPVIETVNSLKDFEGNIALVGLPCHIRAVENLKVYMPELVEKIGLKIGLFCDRVLSYRSIDYLALKTGCDPKKIDSFVFRDKSLKGYPGVVSVVDKNGNNYWLPASERMRIKEFFTPTSCRLCFDKFNIFSDISVGDPHGLNGYDKKKGGSVCVARTKKGLRILNKCIDNDLKVLRSVDYEDILNGQGAEIKKKYYYGFTKVWKESERLLPMFSDYLEKFSESNNKCDIKDIKKNAKILLDFSFRQKSRKETNEIINDVLLREEQIDNNLYFEINKPLVVEIMGTGFINKGAMLMMIAIVNKLKKHFSNIKITARPVEQIKNFMLHDIYPKIPGFIDDRDIDFAFDASGFVYTDKWGPVGVTRMINATRGLQLQGVKIYMLPQAFGPFQNPQVKKLFKIIADQSELIFARDKISYQHLLSAELESDSKLYLAPDFTIDCQPIYPKNAKHYESKVCIVPNYRMIDMASCRDAEKAYYNFLKNALMSIKRKGNDFFFLIHEGNKDLLIANQMKKIINENFEIIIENDPLRAKGYIASSKMIISSRYHALIGGLAHSIPCISTGWSHKYNELFEEYQIQEANIDVRASYKVVEDMVDRMLSGDSRKDYIRKIEAAANEHKTKVAKMWDMIFANMNDSI